VNRLQGEAERIEIQSCTRNGHPPDATYGTLVSLAMQNLANADLDCCRLFSRNAVFHPRFGRQRRNLQMGKQLQVRK
jgi:hypothetical protein